MRITRQEEAEHDSSFTASAKDWLLVDLLIWLHKGHRTALVRVGTGLHAGVVFFDHGVLYRCEWDDKRGLDALLALCRLGDAELCVMQRQLSGPRANISDPTEEVLAQLQARLAARVA